MKIINKLITLIMIILVSFTVFSTRTFAMESWDEMKQKADGFLEAGKQNGGEDVISEDSIQEVAMPIARALLALATGVLTIVTVIMGIKYFMTDASNPNAKAAIKKRLIGLVVSTIVIYGAQGIWALLYNFMTSITG